MTIKDRLSCVSRLQQCVERLLFLETTSKTGHQARPLWGHILWELNRFKIAVAGAIGVHKHHAILVPSQAVLARSMCCRRLLVSSNQLFDGSLA